MGKNKIKAIVTTISSGPSEGNEPVKQGTTVPEVKTDIAGENCMLVKKQKSGECVSKPDQLSPSYLVKKNQQQSNKEKNNSTLRQLWNQFRKDTTIHGLRLASNVHKHKVRRIIWAIALSVMVILLLKYKYTLVKKYLQHTTISNTKMEIVDELPFPSLTLCNLSPFKKSALRPKILVDVFKGATLVAHKLAELDQNHNNMDALHNPISKDWLFNSSFSLEELFIACFVKFQFVKCNNFFTPKVTNFGLCYTFNSQEYVKNNGRMMTSTTGSTMAVTMHMNVNQDEYVFNTYLAAGMKVIVHDPADEPDVDNDGFLASPGLTSFAAIKLIKHKYLPYPYKAADGRYCLDTTAPDFKNPLKFHEMYSRSACLRECGEEFMYNRCKCRAPTGIGNYTMCSFATYVSCYLPIKGVYIRRKNASMCDCPQPCQFNKYSATVSTGYYPADIYLQDFKTLTFKYDRKSHLEIRVYFDNLYYMKVEKIAEFDFEKFVGYAGGHMGLFLGASLLTLSELGEFLFLLCAALTRKIYKHDKQKRMENCHSTCLKMKRKRNKRYSCCC